MNSKSILILSLALFSGLFLLGRSIERFKKEDRYVSVKGFSEREVKANLAVWSIVIRIPCNDLSEGGNTIEQAKIKVVNFLTQHGIAPSEIIQKDIRAIDKQATEYNNPSADQNFRYIISKTLQVRSSNVDTLSNVSRMTDELVKAGVTMSSDQGWQNNGLQLMFTDLNSIKPQMLSDATKNARSAAMEFAKESTTRLGKMRKASQGLFSIMDRDESLGAQDGGYYGSGTSDLFKRVRVVVSVDYFID